MPGCFVQRDELDIVAPDLPPVRRPPAFPEANGRFTSDELRVEYRLVTEGPRMTVTRIPEGASGPLTPPLVLKRVIDGSYVSDDGRTRLMPEGDGFVIDNWRAARIRFRRAD